MTRYRFRVRSPDGQEKVSEFESELASGAKLEAPEWSDQEFAHGDSASVTVKGTGLDGRMIKFIVEHAGPSGWESYASTTAEMMNGVATADVDLHHPYVKAGGDKPEEATPASLRLSCRLMAS